MADHHESCITQNLSHHMTINTQEAQLLAELELEPGQVKKGHVLWKAGTQPE